MNRELLQKAIDERIAGQLGIGVALDNHDAFRNAVRPSTPKSEVLRQSAALLLDDADVWLEMVAEARLSGSDKTRTYTVISESLQTFPELLGSRSLRKATPSHRTSQSIRRGSPGTLPPRRTLWPGRSPK